MDQTHRIERLQELELWTSYHSGQEEPPKRLVYVHYCDICNSVLALRSKLDHLQSFLHTTADRCPTCHFRLDLSLRCRALNIRTPIDLFSGSSTKRSVSLHGLMQSSFSNLALLPNDKATQTTPLEKRLQSESPPLSFGENFLDELCGGVHARQLTVLYGEKVCQTMAERLCVRSQLPIAMGGFDATSVFIDGGNTFDVYQVSNYACILQLDRDEVLRRIKVSRAFTCYQLVNLIVEKLPALLCEEKVRLVVIANLLDMFMDPEIDLNETKQTVNFLSGFLTRFARENNIALVVTCPTSKDGRDALLRQFLTSRAQVVLKAKRAGREMIFALEKHPIKQWTSRTVDDYCAKQISRFNTEKLQVQYSSCRIT